MVQLKGNAAKDMDDMAKKGGGLGRMFGGLISPLSLVTVGIGALGAGLGLAVTAAAEEEVGVERLSQALKNSVPDWQNQTKAVDAAITAAEKKAFTDDAARDSLSLLVGVTKDVALANDAMAGAMDLARLKNIPLQDATNILASAFEGKTKALEKMGLELDKGATKTDILKEVQRVAGGQADTYANTTAGAMDRLKTAFGNALENIGQVILPRVTEALSGLADFVSSEEFQGALTGAVDMIGKGFKWALDTIGPPLVAAAKGVGDFIGAVASGDPQKIKDLFVGLPEPLRNIAGFLTDAAKGASDFVGKLASGDMVAARDLLKELPEPIGKIATGLFDAAKNATDFLGAQTPEGAQFWKDMAVDAENTAGSLAKMKTDADTFLIQLKGINEAMGIQAEKEREAGGLLFDMTETMQRGADIIGGNMKKGFDELGVSLAKTHGGADLLAEKLGTCSTSWQAGREDAAQAWWDDMYNLGVRTELTQEELAGCATALGMGLETVKDDWDRCLTDIQSGVNNAAQQASTVGPVLAGGIDAAKGGAFTAGQGVGDSAVAGLASGVNRSLFLARAAGAAAAFAAMKAAKAELRSGSPSKAFEEIGDDAITGFVQGMGGKLAAVEGAIRSLITALRSLANTLVGQRDDSSFYSAGERAAIEMVNGFSTQQPYMNGAATSGVAEMAGAAAAATDGWYAAGAAAGDAYTAGFADHSKAVTTTGDVTTDYSREGEPGGGGGGGSDRRSRYLQHGGPAYAGHSYVVGERGPELFTPGVSGHVTPNGGMGNTIYLTVYAGIGADGRRIGQEALEVLSHQLGLQGRNVSHRGI